MTFSHLEANEQALRLALSQLPFIMSVPGTRIHSAASTYLQDMKVIPHVLLEVVDLEAQLALCKSGMGAMFSCEIFARHRIQENHGDPIYCIPIDARTASSQLVLAFHRNCYQKKAEKAFIQCTRNFFAEEATNSFYFFSSANIAGSSDYKTG